MPHRRIDTLGKVDAAAWNASQASKKTPNLVRIISGTLSHIKSGTVMHALVQKADHGAFKITLNGESFIVKGLPASLVGKEVTFIVQNNMQQGKLKAELLWIGAQQTDKGAKQANQQPLSKATLSKHSQQSKHSKQGQHATQQAKVLSSLPTGLTTGQSISARVDALHSKHMQLSITMQDAKEPNKNIRHQILTSTMDGFKVGQQFNASIQLSGNHAANKPNVFLNVITQQTTTPAATTLSPAHFKLSAGDTTAAIVQQRLPNGNIQLNIQGTSVETAAPANIKKGDLLMLKMTKAPADFQLLSVQKDAASKALATHKANFSAGNQAISQHLTSLRNTLPAGELSTKQTLASLDSAMKAFEVSPQQPLNGKRLAHMMQHSGNHLEAKLLSLLQNASLTPSIQQDLKAIMLQLSHAQSSKAASSQLIHRLAELGQQSLARIESGQALNVLAHIQQEPIRMELPMLVGQQMVNVQLSMQQNTAHEANQYNDDDDNNTSNQSYNILFALDLSQLGNIRVDANISGNSVHARIYNDNADSKQFIQNHIQRLEERLQSLGFEEVYLISSQQAPNSEKQQRFDQLTQMMPAPSSLNLLDIRI